MGVLVNKVRCPGGLHEDTTPSCAVYSDGSGYCFSCNSFFRKLTDPVAEVKKEPENLKEKLEYVELLPSVQHRGFEFKHDSRGYYLVWPGGTYYKLRIWAPRPGEPKYIGAKGHKKPWFVCKGQGIPKVCVITEGEINALSLSQALPEVDVISPGGASNFCDGEMKSNINYLGKYSKLVIVADEDQAGTEAAIKLHSLLRHVILDVKIRLLEKGLDANEYLIKYGKEKLKDYIMGVQARVYSNEESLQALRETTR